MTRHIHFVGFRTKQQFTNAVRVFGQPDFVHSIHDNRMYGDTGFPIDPKTDCVVFGNKGHDTPHPKYSDNDSDRPRHKYRDF
jgi:hypothetical protein